MPLAYQPERASSKRELLTVRFVRAIFVDRLTPSGRLLFALGFFVTLITVLVPVATKFYFMFCVLLALAIMSPPLARLARVKLDLRLQLPPKATCGADVSGSLWVENVSKRTAVDLGFALQGLPPQITATEHKLAELKPGERFEIQLPMQLARRGYYEVQGVRQETWFPFGVWRDLVFHHKPQTMLVYPHFSPLVHLDIPVGLRYQPGGVALSSNVGDSTEFIGVRQFRPGDSIRNIHWKSWGRVGEPVVKEFQEEFFCKIALVLDTFLPANSGEKYRDDFEACLSVAASIADHLSQTEYIVDLFAAGPDLYTLEAGRNLAHLDNVLDVLACLEPSFETPFERVAPVLTEHLSTITTVIFVMLDWDESRERMARVVAEYGPAVKTILVRAGEPTLDLSGADQEIPHITPDQVRAGVDQL